MGIETIIINNNPETVSTDFDISDKLYFEPLTEEEVLNKKEKENPEEIKEWQTQSVKHKVAYVLMMDGISFRYTEETGIVFSAPDFYVKNLIRRLMSCYGVSLKPIINEFK